VFPTLMLVVNGDNFTISIKRSFERYNDKTIYRSRLKILLQLTAANANKRVSTRRAENGISR
jgi:hypothetical protein